MDTEKFLQGDDWLGHPIHPALVAGPIGLWIFSLLMDGATSVSKNKCIQEAADRAMTVGLVAAGLAAATGLAEYSRVPKDEQAKRDAFTHGMLNAGTASLYGVNAAIRSKRRGEGKSTGLLPKIMSLAGVAVIGYTGWLGGGLAYNYGTGVSQERGEREKKRREELTAKARQTARRVKEEAKAGI